MQRITERDKCSGCGICAIVCPKEAIQMIESTDGFFYPSVNNDLCVNCGMCKKKCSVNTQLGLDKSDKDIIVYAGYNIDDEIRYNSSSGGVFSVIAEWILEKGGVVAGATLTSDLNVEHVLIEKKEDLYRLRGSKYVKSDTKNIYLKVREYLEKDKFVLFTGTPCQVGALYAFLDKDYDKLYTQDLICHGTPSPKVWRKYIEWQEKSKNVKVINANFRNKEVGWKRYSIKLDFLNGEKYHKIFKDDEYLRLFLSDICLRKSCYECSFKGIHRESDITLADYWGCEKEIDIDDKGVSLICLHSNKGINMIESCKDKLKLFDIDVEKAFLNNSAVANSVGKKDNREEFFEKLEKEDFVSLVKDFAQKKKNRKEKLKRIIPSKIKKILKDTIIN